ncbi:glutamate receptor ionotropic, delta-1-like [Oratosquilla oratoria]|uniref:glutamate receptor ionotropic, delta-1-like n=1 Tax=Oratosquilla oratoria TaxID=337810 RepID=UPI003F770B4B
MADDLADQVAAVELATVERQIAMADDLADQMAAVERQAAVADDLADQVELAARPAKTMRWMVDRDKLYGIFLLQMLLCEGHSKLGSYVVNSTQLSLHQDLLMSGLDALEAVMKEAQKEMENPSLCSTLVITNGTTTHWTMKKFMESLLHPQGVTMMEVRTFDGVKFHQKFARAIEKARKLRQSLQCLTVVVVSEDVGFLEWLAEAIQEGRLVVWTTRLIVLTNLQQDDMWQVLAGHWTYSMMSSIFINRVLDVTSFGKLDKRWDLYTYLPYSDQGSTMIHLATWISSRGILKHKDLPFFPKKFESFHGAAVNITARPFEPYWMDEVVEGEERKLKNLGSDYMLVQTVAQSLNFSLKIIPSKSWKEVIEKVQAREVLFTPNYFCMLQSRLKEHDFTIPYEILSWTFVMVKPGLQPQWESLYYPFSKHVWILVFVTLFLVPLPLHLLSRGGTTLCRSSIVALVFGVLLGQNLPSHLSAQSHYRFLLATWLIFCLLISTAYRANLTAFLTKVMELPRPENARQLIELGVRPVMPPYGEHWKSTLLTSTSPIMRELGHRMEFVPNNKVGLEQSATGKFALMEGQPFLKYQIAKSYTRADGSNPFYIGKEAMWEIMCGWPLPYNAPYKHVLDKKISSVLQSGLLNMWRQSIQDEVQFIAPLKKQKQTGTEASTGSVSGMPVPLTLNHLKGVLLLLLLGWSISVATLVTELLLKRC